MAPAQCGQCNGIFESKGKCSDHKRVAGHEAATAYFICLECHETFPKLMDLVHHRENAGHTMNPITTHFPESGSKSIESSHNPRKAPECSTCREVFTTFHELADHRRAAHGQSTSIVIKCERCLQEVPPGEVHSQYCRAGPERVACPVCQQRFRGAADLAKHSAENALSCDVCKVHVPDGMALEDHWRVSNQHPFCTVCNKGFRDSRTWTRHAWVCSLAAEKYARSGTGGDTGVGDTQEACKQVAVSGEEAAKAESTKAMKVDTGREWFLGGLKEASSVASEASFRRSSVSTPSKHTEADGSPGTPSPSSDLTTSSLDQLWRDILRADSILYASDAEGSVHAPCAAEVPTSGPEVVETLAREYGQHNIDHILGVIQDEPTSPARKRSGSTRSLLSPPRPAPETLPPPPESLLTRSDASEHSACDTAPLSLVVNGSMGSDVVCTNSKAEDDRNDSSDSEPPLLGCRRARERPAPKEPLVAEAEVPSWLRNLSQTTYLPQSYSTARSVAPSPDFEQVRVVKEHRPERGAGSSKMSWHCRLCLRQPCSEPVATICGHVFCHE
ncbi:hypothetical protein C8Q78DRAFT_675998 [Trametes maxima]|nr:hypothetical protein C8Q78DRAFT_675998 [Trametes maxima]